MAPYFDDPHQRPPHTARRAGGHLRLESSLEARGHCHIA
jgi:hypothetical protein